jgi:hypothetical protein
MCVCACMCAYHNIMVKLMRLLHNIKDTIKIEISYSLNNLFTQEENYTGLGSFVNL